jgi:glucose/arabinose dehydrogenase
MVNKVIIVLFIFIGIVAGALYFGKQYIGDIRPVILPLPSSDSSQTSDINVSVQPKKGEPLSFDLTFPDGFSISLFAKDIGNARDLEFSPGGTLVVSQPNQGKVTALPDKNNDGIVEEVKNIVSGLDNPHGLAFYNNKLFVAEETQVVRYSWDEQNLQATRDKVLFSLPKGGRHTSRTLAFDKDGKLFVSLGSTCDVCFEKDERISTVMISDAEGTNPRIFAKGLRNAVFITVNSKTNELWGTEMGRDFLGDSTPPDEINIIKDGKDYGWPVCYGDQIEDAQFTFKLNFDYREHCKQATEKPVYSIPAHSAPLGLTFIDSKQFPEDWQGDLLVSYHGSWNRSTPIGYKVVRMNIENGKVTNEEDFITGFLKGSQAVGRPVDVIFDTMGNLYISDDKAGAVYVVSKK